MKLTVLAFALAAALPASAHMGDSLAQTLFAYGQPSASSPKKPGQATSTRTFNISGLIIVCGYLDGKVVMETITNPDRDFVPAEVEALLRTESENQKWSPPGPYVGTMNYQRADGATARLTGNKLEIITPAWTTALAKDAAAKAALTSTNAPAP